MLADGQKNCQVIQRDDFLPDTNAENNEIINLQKN